MVDETYVEFADEQDEITAVSLTNYYNNIIILRGISKFFAAPGLRLGYAVTGNHDLLKAMNTRKNPWTINSLAEAAGELMFSDVDYIKRTRQLITSERKKILQQLSDMDSVKVYEPIANFVLFRILKDTVTSDQVFEHAIRRNMMIRDCSTFPFLDHKYVRFCFMMPDMNQQLIQCLQDIL